jgi:hypothetical protein
LPAGTTADEAQEAYLLLCELHTVLGVLLEVLGYLE